VLAQPSAGKPIYLDFDSGADFFRELVSDETVAEIVQAANDAGEETWMDRRDADPLF